MSEGHSEALAALEEPWELGNRSNGSARSETNGSQAQLIATGHAKCKICKSYLSLAFAVRKRGKWYCGRCASY